MRIISGKYRGRKLNSPQGREVRPTTERVKEAIFSIILPYLDEAVVLDLFAGSGGLGIEALSRGAKHVYFCDISEKSIAVIRQNVETLDVSSDVTLLNCDFKRVSNRINKKIDIVLVDAPYNMCEYSAILDTISDGNYLADDALILIERDRSKAGYEISEKFVLNKTKKYGNTEVDILFYSE